MNMCMMSTISMIMTTTHHRESRTGTSISTSRWRINTSIFRMPTIVINIDVHLIIKPMNESNSRNLKLIGGALVALQFGLIAWQLVLAAPAIMQGHFPAFTWLLAGGALALAVWTLRHNRMGNFNIHPAPKLGGVLVTSGPYRWIRHPMYTTVLLGAAALGWMSDTALAWPVWVALALVLLFKLTMEERWLQERYPNYDAYKRVSKRLLPWIL